MGIKKVGIPFRLLCSPPSEGGREGWWTGQRVSPEEGTLAQTLPEQYVPLVLRPRATSDFSALQYHVASKLCQISQTILLFHSWLPIPGFIDSFSHCLCAKSAAGFVSLYFSTCVCDSLRICHAVSQSPVVCSQLISVPSDCHWCAAYFPFQVINE